MPFKFDVTDMMEVIIESSRAVRTGKAVSDPGSTRDTDSAAHHPRVVLGNFAQVLWPRLEDREVYHGFHVYCQDGGNIATPVAIIGRRPDCHEQLAEKVFVTLHGELV